MPFIAKSGTPVHRRVTSNFMLHYAGRQTASSGLHQPPAQGCSPCRELPSLCNVHSRDAGAAPGQCRQRCPSQHLRWWCWWRCTPAAAPGRASASRRYPPCTSKCLHTLPTGRPLPRLNLTSLVMVQAWLPPQERLLSAHSSSQVALVQGAVHAPPSHCQQTRSWASRDKAKPKAAASVLNAQQALDKGAPCSWHPKRCQKDRALEQVSAPAPHSLYTLNPKPWHADPGHMPLAS